MATDIAAARQGLMKFIAKKGGSIPIRELHTHSLVFYQAGHQAFSEIMEGLVADELVVFQEGAFQLTEKGRSLLQAQPS
jgi:predicted transcriptional regulator